MIFKDSLRNSIEENGGPADKTAHAEKVYHRFFAGYTARVEASAKGNKVRYEYTSEYYTQQLSGQKRLGVKCLYVLLYLMTCAGFLLASIAPVESNCVWYVGISQAMCVFSLGWMLIALLYYVSAPKLMTIYLRRTMIGFHFHCASVCMLISFALASLTSAVWLVLHIRVVGPAEVCCALTYLLCLAFSFATFFTEKHIQYLPVENHTAGVQKTK